MNFRNKIEQLTRIIQEVTRVFVDLTTRPYPSNNHKINHSYSSSYRQGTCYLKFTDELEKLLS